MTTDADPFERLREAHRRLGAEGIVEPSEANNEAVLGIQRLEQIFGGVEGLQALSKRFPTHPAVKQYKGLERVTNSPAQLSWPNEFEDLEVYAGVLIDSFSWAPKPPYKDIFQDLGEDARRWVVPSLKSPDRYEDVMAELYFWGRLRAGFRAGGFDCELLESEGMPDLMLGGSDGMHYCEVKRIHVGTQPSRVAKIVQDANRKFKVAGDSSAGSLLISVAREPGRARLDDRVPNDVVPYVNAARATLNPGKNRSVAEILICWDDFLLLGRFPDPVFHFFIRKSVRIDHPEPRPASKALDVDTTSISIVSGAHWPNVGSWNRIDHPPTPARQYGDVVITELFRSTSEFHDGIRAGHALEVMQEPDCIVGYREGDLADVFLATRRTELLSVPSTLLIVAARRPGHPIEVQAGFHLVELSGSPPELEFNAEGAFAELLQRFGRNIRVGDQTGRFIHRVTTSTDTAIKWQGQGSVSLFAVSKQPAPNRIEHRWVFCVDIERYRASLKP